MKIYTLGFLLGVGFLLFAFSAWRRLVDLGYPEEKIVDFILALSLWGLLASRLFYVFFYFDQFGLAFGRWFLLGRFPGLSFWGGLGGGFLSLVWFVRKEKWPFWQIFDEVIFAVLPFLTLAQLGCFFDGTSPGKATSLPWGIYFQESLVRRHPVSLFYALGLLFVWFFLLKIERQWRAWKWYQSQAAGFISLVFLAFLFLLNFLLAFWRQSSLYFYWLEIFLSLGGLVAALILFYGRSGRSKFPWLKRKSNQEKSQ